MSVKLKKITFTGIDEKTGVERLIELFHDYPKVEFGFLALANHGSVSNNRYCSPSILREYKDKGLPLSLHVCGILAKRIITTGDWNETVSFMQGYFSLFDRIQLNVGWVDMTELKWKLAVPAGVSEVIIQQPNAEEMPVYRMYLNNQASIGGNFTVLLDASGGRGTFLKSLKTLPLPYVGYAGGLGPDNVADTVLSLEYDEAVQSYWIDMETKVRKRGCFSIELCRKVCEAIDDFAR